MRMFRKKPKLGLVTGGNAADNESTPRTRAGLAAETHLRIMVEQMVREGRSVDAIEEAVRQAA
jgi:hypothetical protein